MRRSHLLAFGAFYLVAQLALAAADSEDSDTTEIISAIRTEVVAADRLAGEFEVLAGSHQNAQNLVVGLRNAKPIVLAAVGAAKTEANFTPSTRPMSFSDIHTALSLAQAQLKSKRIDSPTPAQIKASLAGGELPNANGEMTQVIGILPLHRRGMSWDQIARALRLDSAKRTTNAAIPLGSA